MADFAPLADVAGVGFESSVGDGAMVLGIESELERLCGILIDNAIKYCDAGWVVRVALSVERRIVRLGVGNPCADLRKDDLARVFDRFYRAEPSRVRTDAGRTGAEGDVPQSRRTGGYGIGLSLAQSIAEKHGGKMRAKKNGDVVWFTAVLPRAVR